MNVSSLATTNLNARFDQGRPYFEWNVIKDFIVGGNQPMLHVKTIIQQMFIPKFIRKGTVYNSKQSTGMVGLENLGATCYLNALLQVSKKYPC